MRLEQWSKKLSQSLTDNPRCRTFFTFTVRNHLLILLWLEADRGLDVLVLIVFFLVRHAYTSHLVNYIRWLW
nr:MAG TPA: hypothetical protein [Caudoviricetes sp.]DAW39973.1 MAG TPA: hypothetical protein [Caudoviricetes sp.]